MILKKIQKISFSMPISFIIWFLDSVATKTKILVCVSWAIASIIWYLSFEILIIYKENKELKDELKIIKERHEGLTHEYDKKLTQIKNYSYAWQNLGQIFYIALTTNDNTEKIKNMYDAYLLNSQYIEGNDFINEKHGKSN